MTYLTEAMARVSEMFSAGQYGALVIVFVCVYVAYKTAKKVLSIIATVVACFAVVYFLAPNFYPEMLRLLYNGFMALTNMAVGVTTGG